ncbi:MAG: hypothetical protein J6O51_02005 [Bacteroidales bacterium]|nr:hypothetical protein [Bacteroidales bacterium]
MKRFVLSAACIIAALSFLASCQPKETPDGKCEIQSFVLTSGLNSALTADVNGIIDATAKTITLYLPALNTSTFIPTFTVTDHDVVKIGGAVITSAETSVAITDGTKVSVSDEVSALNVEYTIAVEENDGAAALSSVVFKAADNSQLLGDVAPEVIEPQMLVRVPAAAFRQELVLTVAAGKNDAIKVNNTAVESGASIKVDTSFPIDITVTDDIAGQNASYVLKVGKVLGYVVTKLGSYTEGSISDFTMELNPVDNLPYFAYIRKVGDEKNNNISVARWTGSGFTVLGTSGFADVSSRSASRPKIAFAQDGTTYAFYIGGDVASKPTVKRFDSDWTLVGTAGITEHNNNSSFNYPFFVHPANSRPSFFWCGNTKKQADYRTMSFSQFSGDSWTSTLITGVIPALGSDNSNGMYYGSSAAVLNGKLYIASSFNQHGYYIHEVGADGSLTTIVENFVPGNSPHGLPSNLKLASNGELYLLAADRGASVMQLYTVDIAGKTLTAFGNGIPVTISAKGDVDEHVSFSVSPADLLVVSVYDTADGIPEFAYMTPDTGYQWAKFTVDAPVAAKSAYTALFDKDGKCYVAYQSADAIELYSIGLEADVIPE